MPATDGPGPAPDADMVWVAVPRGALGAAGGTAATASPAPTLLPSGRFGGFDADQARIELRIDGRMLSGDIFRLQDRRETWVAGFRARPGTAVAAGAALPVIAQDRHGATGEGQITLTMDGSELSVSLTLAAKLDGLPVGTPIRALAKPLGAAYRQLGLEVLRERGIPAPPRMDRDGRAFGIAEALADAGLEVTELEGRDDLPAAPAGGWSEKQLHALMADFARSDLDRAGFGLRLLWLSGSNRPDLQGLMFDTVDDLPRQGAAVFTEAVRRGAADDRLAPRLIQTAVHELGHALNLTHRFERETGYRASLSFMNYDWKYEGGPAAYWRQFAYSFDPDELSFLHHGHFRAIVPGGDAFGSARYWSAHGGGYSPILPEHTLEGWKLELLPPEGAGAAFAFAQPVLVGLRFTNLSGQEIKVPGDFLDQKAGHLQVVIESETRGRRGAASVFRPITVRCSAASASVRAIAPDEEVLDNLNLTFGVDGFAFAEPGTYRLTAFLVLEAGDTEYIVRSEPLRIRILTPASREEDVAALDIIEPGAGAILALGGTAAFERSASRLMEAAERLSSAGRGRRRSHPVAAGIYRALGFHFGRGYIRYRDGRFATSAPSTEDAAYCAARLRDSALDFLDPVSKSHTLAFARSVMARAGHEAGPTKRGRPPPK